MKQSPIKANKHTGWFTPLVIMNTAYCCLFIFCVYTAAVSGQGLCKQRVDIGTLCPGGNSVYPRYAHVNGRCAIFWYLQCGGNDNNFE